MRASRVLHGPHLPHGACSGGSKLLVMVQDHRGALPGSNQHRGTVRVMPSPPHHTAVLQQLGCLGPPPSCALRVRAAARAACVLYARMCSSGGWVWLEHGLPAAGPPLMSAVRTHRVVHMWATMSPSVQQLGRRAAQSRYRGLRWWPCHMWSLGTEGDDSRCWQM
jgi:hypothetical protein